MPRTCKGVCSIPDVVVAIFFCFRARLARKCKRSDPCVDFYSTPSRITIVYRLNSLISQVAHWYSGINTDRQYWHPEFEPPYKTAGCGFDFPVWKFTFLSTYSVTFALPFTPFMQRRLSPLF